jgi:serine/threonine protein kinase
MKDYFAVGDGSYAIAMSFVEGKTLDKVIDKHKAIHPEDTCWIMQRLFGVLHYLHSNGIVHSDVKPQNLIVQPKIHNAVLIDFGLSANRPNGSTKAIGYTEAFAAPELKAGSPPIPESDLYGAGLVMIYALGGDPIGKIFPQHVPKQITDFCESLIQNDPTLRPNWEKTDLVGRLSDIRLSVFGRRHSI